MISRNKEQEQIMFIIYQALFQYRMDKSFDMKEIIEDTLDMPYEEVSLFVREVSIKVVARYKEIREIIEPNCNKWNFDRINLIIIAILMLGIGEYKYVGDVDKSVIIDVCVKLAKKYGDEKDYRFVNALLDKVL